MKQALLAIAKIFLVFLTIVFCTYGVIKLVCQYIQNITLIFKGVNKIVRMIMNIGHGKSSETDAENIDDKEVEF